MCSVPLVCRCCRLHLRVRGRPAVSPRVYCRRHRGRGWQAVGLLGVRSPLLSHRHRVPRPRQVLPWSAGITGRPERGLPVRSPARRPGGLYDGPRNITPVLPESGRWHTGRCGLRRPERCSGAIALGWSCYSTHAGCVSRGRVRIRPCPLCPHPTAAPTCRGTPRAPTCWRRETADATPRVRQGPLLQGGLAASWPPHERQPRQKW